MYLGIGAENNMKIKIIIWSIDPDIYTYTLYIFCMTLSIESLKPDDFSILFFSYFWL